MSTSLQALYHTLGSKTVFRGWRPSGGQVARLSDNMGEVYRCSGNTGEEGLNLSGVGLWIIKKVSASERTWIWGDFLRRSRSLPIGLCGTYGYVSAWDLKWHVVFRNSYVFWYNYTKIWKLGVVIYKARKLKTDHVGRVLSDILRNFDFSFWL